MKVTAPRVSTHTRSLTGRQQRKGSRCILYAVLGSLPLLANRLAYSLLVDFEDKSTFSIIDREATVQLCMAITEEFIVMIFSLVAGCVALALNSLMKTVDLLRGHQPAL